MTQQALLAKNLRIQFAWDELDLSSKQIVSCRCAQIKAWRHWISAGKQHRQNLWNTKRKEMSKRPTIVTTWPKLIVYLMCPNIASKREGEPKRCCFPWSLAWFIFAIFEEAKKIFWQLQYFFNGEKYPNRWSGKDHQVPNEKFQNLNRVVKTNCTKPWTSLSWVLLQENFQTWKQILSSVHQKKNTLIYTRRMQPRFTLQSENQSLGLTKVHSIWRSKSDQVRCTRWATERTKLLQEDNKTLKMDCSNQ